MGIPKFFKWLTRRYPLILQNLENEQDCPPTDNLYLDLNGIVHNAIHGNDKTKHERVSKLADLEEVWAEIMRAIDEIVHIIKPRKFILLALDGVAPRAKMNQQRARRFRSHKDAQELREQLASRGKDVPQLFDGNQISPGTKFMYELGKQLEWFVKYKVNTDPIYKQCVRVVLSDSSVPGEGEHKMMDYIRNLQRDPEYDPNTRHVFYGADADLIMLSLLTHQPNFMILREEHVVKKVKQGGVQRIDISKTNNFQIIHIALLREYFLLEYRELAPKMRMRFDLERIIDDFIFFCFFIGNDFLPSLSALDIGEGSLDHLIKFYKQCLPLMKDYITDHGQIHWDRAAPFIELLGTHEHQVFINRVKTLDQRYTDSKTFVQLKDGMKVGGSQTILIQQQVQQKLKAKKEKKCDGLKAKNQQKKYKKFLLLKKFAEDEDEENSGSGDLFIQKQVLLKKYKQIRSQHEESKTEPVEGETLHDVLSGLKEEYFSDVKPEDIPNSEVSEIDESELKLEMGDKDVEEMELENQLESQVEINKGNTQKFIEKNHQFMSEFVNQYKENAGEARRSYYLEKLEFDTLEPKGKKDLYKMLYRYLEGMQWVLFYYYRGAPHWRWYYPYHYAPLISDLGSNIVSDFLDGQTTITEFKPDTHCNPNPKPYTPFQQLLCIFPIKSIESFMPKEYAELARGPLADFFPDSFDIDLNGKTLPWEAVILIPFADEELFIAEELKKVEAGMRYTTQEQQRNTTSFIFPSYHFDKEVPNGNRKVLMSRLTQMDDLPYDFSDRETHDDYENVGKFSFQSKIDPSVKKPCDFPTFETMKINQLVYTKKYINKVEFKLCLVQVPSCKEDNSGELFEAWIYNWIRQTNAQAFCGFPFSVECFPSIFEDPFSIYTIVGEPGNFGVHKARQTRSEDQYRIYKNQIRSKLKHEGIEVGENFNTMVTVHPIKGTDYNDFTDEISRTFDEGHVIPFNLLQQSRDPYHFLNLNPRLQNKLGRVQPNHPAICFNSEMFGVMCLIKSKDARHQTVKAEFDRQSEENKIHNPWMAENYLKHQYEKQSKALNKKGKKQDDAIVDEEEEEGTFTSKFYGDREIETFLKLKQGSVNRLTGSLLIAYDEEGKDQRQVVDVGLNLKNFTKRVHIPDYVRFVQPNTAANVLFDVFNHNQHYRGANHIRKHWEYSEDCFGIVREYQEKFPEVFELLLKILKKSKAMNTLNDIYPGVAKEAQIENLKKVLEWLEGLPISKLPYVEMGFDALDLKMTKQLQSQQEFIQKNYKHINLDINKVEMMPANLIYQEHFPYWCGPFPSAICGIEKFRVGNRVMNINSTLRQYIPFGLRGTVVGKTDLKVIVMFDEQFLHGSDVYGHCQMYRGAYVSPENLLNLTVSFASMAKQDPKLTKQFQEKPAGSAAFIDQLPKKVLQEMQDEKELHKQQRKEFLESDDLNAKPQPAPKKKEVKKKEVKKEEKKEAPRPQKQKKPKKEEVKAAPRYQPKNVEDVAKEISQEFKEKLSTEDKGLFNLSATPFSPVPVEGNVEPVPKADSKADAEAEPKKEQGKGMFSGALFKPLSGLPPVEEDEKKQE